MRFKTTIRKNGTIITEAIDSGGRTISSEPYVVPSIAREVQTEHGQQGEESAPARQTKRRSTK
jgi:hypothetical protein